MEERLERTKGLDEEYVMQTYKRLPVAFAHGSGTRLWDTEGKQYIDMVSGLGVTVLGHSHPRVVDAITRQVRDLIHTTNLYYVEPQAELARMLVENSFEGRCFFVNSGAEANEGALKLARKHHYANGRPRKNVVCALGSFHGRTLATLSATGQPSKWEPFAPTVEGFTHVKLNDIAELEAAVDEDTIAVMLEPIQGESGVNPASPDFLKAARRCCDQSGALLILDEIQTGLGRTGKLFAYQHAGVPPDIMTLAKGLANGVPIGVFMASADLGEVLSPGDHGTTFGGGFLACAAAVETIRVIVEENLPRNAELVGKLLADSLESMVGRIPLVKEVRGMGLMLAVELTGEKALDVVMGCMEEGVLVNNVTPNTVRLLPPLIITDDEALRGFRVLERVIAAQET